MLGLNLFYRLSLLECHSFIQPHHLNTVKPVLSNHIKQDIFLAFQASGCLLLHEGSAESSRRLSVLLLFSKKQSPTYSDFHVT